MTRFLVVTALAVATVLPVATAPAMAEAERASSARQEAIQTTPQKPRGLKAVFDSFLKPQKSREPAAAPTVSFSRSWIDSQPKANGDEEWRCLSEALYFEARGETVKGQFAVGEVIVNRVKSDRFPGTLCGVIYQGTGRKYQCQFTYTCDGSKETIAEPKAFERVAKVARVILDGASDELTNGATHYHTRNVRPSWSKVFTRTAEIGVHVFYRDNYRTASAD